VPLRDIGNSHVPLAISPSVIVQNLSFPLKKKKKKKKKKRKEKEKGEKQRQNCGNRDSRTRTRRANVSSVRSLDIAGLSFALCTRSY
jgi:hypothetical protein